MDLISKHLYHVYKYFLFVRQKMKILGLERSSKQTESDVHKALLHRIHDEGDAMSMQLQVRAH